MVSLRCKLMVKQELKKLGLHYVIVELGMVEILENLTTEQQTLFKICLLNSGLELMEDKKIILIEDIKKVIIEMIRYSDDLPKLNYSQYISKKLNRDYAFLASSFSEIEGMTIEHYIINLKIERVKELVLFNENNLTEIAYLMHYSSVAHLSNQFKKVTGLTPSHFKQLQQKN